MSQMGHNYGRSSVLNYEPDISYNEYNVNKGD